MHASSLENMRICFDRFIATAPYFVEENVVVVDVGGADVNGGYKNVFSDPKFHYMTVDLSEGQGVDIVLEDPYRLPFADNSVDVVLSGQMLEHCEFFWLSFAEMMRIVKPTGHMILIAPSAGPIHRYPVDCYRFYPDAYYALAKYANCKALDVWLDERGPWRDLVGVFSKHVLPARKPVTVNDSVAPFDPFHSSPGSAEEESMSGERPYFDVLRDLHQAISPSLYVEIGIRHGRSLSLAQGKAIGIDPAPDLKFDISSQADIFTMPSDQFFRDEATARLAANVDMAFIDGMHLFEYALRDFMNIELLATPDTLVIIDDIFPNHPTQAARTRSTRVWTGDVWKLQACLTELRPDLLLLPLNTHPSGLLLVAGLNPSNRVLWDHYNPTVRLFSEMEVPASVINREYAASPDATAGLRIDALAQTRRHISPTLVAKLKSAFINCV